MATKKPVNMDSLPAVEAEVERLQTKYGTEATEKEVAEVLKMAARAQELGSKKYYTEK